MCGSVIMRRTQYCILKANQEFWKVRKVSFIDHLQLEQAPYKFSCYYTWSLTQSKRSVSERIFLSLLGRSHVG